MVETFPAGIRGDHFINPVPMMVHIRIDRGKVVVTTSNGIGNNAIDRCPIKKRITGIAWTGIFVTLIKISSAQHFFREIFNIGFTCQWIHQFHIDEQNPGCQSTSLKTRNK